MECEKRVSEVSSSGAIVTVASDALPVRQARKEKGLGSSPFQTGLARWNGIDEEVSIQFINFLQACSRVSYERIAIIHRPFFALRAVVDRVVSVFFSSCSNGTSVALLSTTRNPPTSSIKGLV